ncbi:4-hydroxybenzoate polyprenyltransferase, mitochondrial, partial [Leucoagaricus sp. SymC.cos]
ASGLTLAAHKTGNSFVDLSHQLFVFFLDSTVVHSGACIINDILDRDLDSQVEHIKNRPLACGAVSVGGACIFLVAHVAASILLLACSHELTFRVGLIGIFPVHALYALMKRLVMNWGLPVAWMHTIGPYDLPMLSVLFCGTWSWTMIYDTIYGCTKDDVKADICSTSLLFGSRVRFILTPFAVHLVGSLLVAGLWNNNGLSYFVISVFGAALYLSWQLGTLNPDDPADC